MAKSKPEATFFVVNKNERYILSSFLTPSIKTCICFIYNVSETTVLMVNIKTLKNCENLLKVAPE